MLMILWGHRHIPSIETKSWGAIAPPPPPGSRAPAFKRCPLWVHREVNQSEPDDDQASVREEVSLERDEDEDSRGPLFCGDQRSGTEHE